MKMKTNRVLSLAGIGLMIGLCACTAGSRDADTTAQIEEYKASGIESYKSGDYESAADCFFQAMTACGDIQDVLYADVTQFYAACLYEEEDYDQALTYFEKVITCKMTTDEDLAQAYYLQGCCYIAKEDENDAVTSFENSLGSKDSDYDMYVKMYQAFLNAGYTDRAESYLKRIISNENSSNLDIGRTYYYLEQYTDAESFLTKAVDEKEQDAVYFLGLTYEAMEEYSKADEFYNQYLKKNPGDAMMYNQYGAYLMSREEYQTALSYIEDGLALENLQDALQPLLYNQAVCYEYLLDYDRALELMKTYTETYPEDTAAEKELEFLETRV